MLNLAPDMENATLNWSVLKKLSEDSINSNAPDSAGVYRLSFKDTNDDNYYVFYVAKSDNIKDALLKHFLDETINPCIAIKVKTNTCAFRFAECSDVRIQNAAVFQAYKHYQPTCNATEPDSTNIEELQVNLS